MSGRCIVEFCKNYNVTGLAYFRLTVERHDPWMRAIGRDPSRFSTGNSYYVPQPYLVQHLADNKIQILNKGEVVPEPVAILPYMMQPVSSHQTISVSVSPRIVTYSTVPKESSMQQFIKQEPDDTNVTVRKPPINDSSKNVSQSDYERKMTTFITKKTIVRTAERMKEIQLKNRRLEKRLAKVNRFLENLGDTCDISEITKQLITGPSNIVTNVDDSSTDSDLPQDSVDHVTENLKVEIIEEDASNSYVSSADGNKQDVTTLDDDVEDCSTRINAFSTESQVQITFLAGSDTAKEGLLKRKLKQLAENDIIKSKKLRELNNIIFIKNKVISELREEIAKLKEKV